jgi:phosphoenolpyruvate carboxykinase (ATP)
MVWHPGKYAELLASKIEKHGAQVWLVNTGWTGGAYGTGSRMKLKYTRCIVDAIHSGELAKAEFSTDPIFGVEIPKACEGVPAELLTPRTTWKDPARFDETARKLAYLFKSNFTSYEDGVSAEVKQAGPQT